MKGRFLIVAAAAFVSAVAVSAAGTPRTLRIVERDGGEPIRGVAVMIKGWNHSTLIRNRGEFIDPGCCSIDRRIYSSTDTAGRVAVPGEALRRDFTLVEITAPEHKKVQLLFEKGRPELVRIDHRDIDGRALDVFLGAAGRDSDPLTIAMPKEAAASPR